MALLRVALFAVFTVLFVVEVSIAQQDTLRLNLQEFIERSRIESALLNAQRSSVELSQNRVDQAKSQRILPRIELSTAHGLVPAVKSDIPGLPEGQYYLDPNLRNDWYDWGFFNRVEVTSLQPIYTWGAIGNAINAARQGVIVAEAEFAGQQADYELRLMELYYSRLLAMELQNLINDAWGQIEEAEEKIAELIEDGDEDLEEADLFQFRIFKYEFLSRMDEVNESVTFTESAWNLALNNDNKNVVYLPETNFLDPIPFESYDIRYYEEHAQQLRSEIKQYNAIQNAAEYGLKINKVANYPSLFMGLSASFAKTPNRPKQRNPFIINNTNYESVSYGIGFRQNLNFLVNKNNINRSQLQVRQARYAKEAARDGILLDVREKFRNMMMSYSKLENTREALQISEEWLRLEQIDYDLGFGEVKKLVDAVKANLELEASYKQRIFEFNVNSSKLNRAAGLPIAPTN
ncbi:MAG TPA: TolC family protein [Bacteroidetes bacterium]|nr:TolC family protein [Bacteroidota bacterium]